MLVISYQDAAEKKSRKFSSAIVLNINQHSRNLGSATTSAPW
jgi:hypothetical protein